ncbi:MAG: type II toxin-antitoxin system VapB family antitoxin [Proteobacteria bacterium]|nr:type II toxin-antitoxin system VapB family antitoxin [Pseudomonadota bacterium]
MALNIRNQETEDLASNLAQLTGETKTETVKKSLRERLNRVLRKKTVHCLVDELDRIATHCASLPILDERSAEEILYDKKGLPK